MLDIFFIRYPFYVVFFAFFICRASLMRSLCYCVATLEYVTNKLHLEIKHHPRVIGEIAHYCAVCDVRSLNFLHL